MNDVAVSQEIPESWQLEEAEGPSWKPSEGAALPTLSFHTSGLQNWERIPFCSFWPSLWPFVMAALRNESTFLQTNSPQMYLAGS